MKIILSIVALFLMSTLFFAQNKIYASSQTNQVSGICLGCNVENPQNSVGSNEDDYSSFKIGIGVIGKVEQTLIFPSSTSKKFVIGIGTNNIPLSVSLLQGVSIETFNGDISNNDLQFIDSSILKLGSQTNKATIEIQPTKAYDRIKISLNSGLLNLSGGLRIYYTYYEDHCLKAFVPVHHYSFDGNTLDTQGGYINLIRTSPHEETFSGNMICNKGLTYSSPDSTYVFKANNFLNVPSPRDPRTVSFWARIEQGGSVNLTIYGESVKITPDSIIIKPANENHGFDKRFFGRMFRKNLATAGVFNFYVINFNNDPTPPYSTNSNFYLPNDKAKPPYYAVDLKISVNNKSLPGPFNLFPAGNVVNDYPTIISSTHWAPYHTQGTDLTNNEFIISFKQAQIDEFLIFDRKIYPEELLNAYSSPSNNAATEKITSSIEADTFTVSPNPTSGQVTLNGNILLVDSDISIRNTSGTEVYHSKFRSKTFDLPSNLPEGVYILTVQTKDKKAYTRKIILKK